MFMISCNSNNFATNAIIKTLHGPYKSLYVIMIFCCIYYPFVRGIYQDKLWQNIRADHFTTAEICKSEEKNNTGWVMQSVGFLEINRVPLVGLHVVADDCGDRWCHCGGPGCFNRKMQKKIAQEGKRCKEIRMRAESESRRLNEEWVTSVSQSFTAPGIHTELIKVFINTTMDLSLSLPLLS